MIRLRTHSVGPPSAYRPLAGHFVLDARLAKSWK
jgi:hypothetical protein